MVDFNKHLNKNFIKKPLNPLSIYEALDRESDKGELRKAQREILNTWFEKSKDKNDVIVKLHTGKGKTLIGLLMLQSKINNNEGPCLYLCPNKYLVEQTCIEAKSFGIKVCKADNDLPIEFENGEKILVTTVSKLFNGKTKFNRGTNHVHINTIVFDDSHACLDIIQNSFTIKIPSSHNAYGSFISLFATTLKEQGQGTYLDIKEGKPESFLVIPYWNWENNIDEVTSILHNHVNEEFLMFTWSILKDNLKNCSCIISGEYLEISPYLLPIENFPSFYNAKHKIYMSATVNNDSFFIKHLNVSIDAIQNPIAYDKESWSGEKMLLIPSLIDDELNKEFIMNFFTKKVFEKKALSFGICILAPSFKYASPWENNGAILAKRELIGETIKSLKQGDFSLPVVFANRYDGIDLPDAACRILIFDGMPHFESLADCYYEICLPDTEIINTRLAQKIEQGLGRNIRGEKDYGAIIILGKELIRFLRSKKYAQYFSHQTIKQIDIGLQITEFAKEEIEDTSSLKVFKDLLNQLLKRDDNWKEFYINNMNQIKEIKENKILDELKMQRDAESLFLQNKVNDAIDIVRNFLNNNKISEKEYGWYLQQIARYQNRISKTNSIKTQQSAHCKNNYLLKPFCDIEVKKLRLDKTRQSQKIKSYYNEFQDYNELLLYANEITENLKFGNSSEKFEHSIKNLGNLLGFCSERPDKQWKEGPDNLWAVAENNYFVIECKNEVLSSRSYISRSETGQMNNSCGWFNKIYQKAQSLNILIIPTLNIEKGANFNYDVKIMREANLEKLKNNFLNFIKEFSEYYLTEFDIPKIDLLLDTHKLTHSDFSIYIEKPKEIVLHKDV